MNQTTNGINIKTYEIEHENKTIYLLWITYPNGSWTHESFTTGDKRLNKIIEVLRKS